MMKVATLVSFISGLGVGSVISIWIKHKLDEKSKAKDIWIKEYKEACVGIITAISQVSVMNSKETKMEFAKQEAIMRLLASSCVIEAIHEFKISPANSEERKCAEDKMLTGMRKDLGITNL